MSADQNEIYVVDIDNNAAARRATEVIIAQGRRNLATIAGPQDMGAGLDRFVGFKQAAQAAGLEPLAIEIGDYTPASGHHIMDQLLKRQVAIDGLFTASAQMGFGALQALKEAGINVPKDILVTSVDDDSFARSSNPPLTTIAQYPQQQGEAMAELLIKRIQGQQVPQWSIMDTELVLRDSH